MAYERHQAEEDVLANPGRRDITAHVNFTALEARGRDFGLDSLGLCTQAQFLSPSAKRITLPPHSKPQRTQKRCISVCN